MLGAGLLAADLVALAFANAEDAAVGWKGGVAFALLYGNATAAAARAFAPLAPVAPAAMNGRQLLHANAFAVLAPLVLAAGGARRSWTHIGDAFAIHTAPERRAELVRRGTGAHVAIGSQIELHAALALRIVALARQSLRIVVLIQRCG